MTHLTPATSLTDCLKSQPAQFAQLAEIQTTPGVHQQVELYPPVKLFISPTFLSSNLKGIFTKIRYKTRLFAPPDLTLKRRRKIAIVRCRDNWLWNGIRLLQCSTSSSRGEQDRFRVLPFLCRQSVRFHLLSGKGSLRFLFSCPMQQLKSGRIICTNNTLILLPAVIT